MPFKPGIISISGFGHKDLVFSESVHAVSENQSIKYFLHLINITGAIPAFPVFCK